ncbi:MAG TPA: hypothetical protein VFE62_16945 [Gemmataceae bacterium]|nr:hypothetical protein [Gemmataceae bacterium]
MIVVLPKNGSALKVRQLVRLSVTGYSGPLYAPIAKVVRTKGKACSYELEHTYLPRSVERRRYAESELEPVLEIFIVRADAARGFELIVRNSMTRTETLGTLAKVGKRWHATPANASGPLPVTFTSRMKAAMALIERRKKRSH